MTTVKQICLGMAVAGAVAGGSVAGAAVAYAEPAGSDSDSSSSTADRPSAAEKPARDKSAREPLGALKKAAAKAGITKPGIKVRPDVPKLSERFAAAVEAARTAKDGDRDTALTARWGRDSDAAPLREVSKIFSRKIDSIVEASAKPRRTVDIRVTDRAAELPRLAVHRDDDISEALTAVTEPATTSPAPAPVTMPTTLVARAAQSLPARIAVMTAPRAPLSPARVLRSVPTPSSPTPLLPLTVAGASPVVATTTRRATAQEAVVQTTSAPTQRVLVIGVDGVNLSKILEDPVTNDQFIRMMNNGTTSASTIAGHTTISNPSWTTILTGVWDNKSGVINNMFTPRTYNKWPTVFDQLEGANPAIRTKVIADWAVITDIGNAGSHGADDVVLVQQVAGDDDWSKTDAEVTAEAVKSILGAAPGYEEVPNFMFTYLVQVDEAGHAYGGVLGRVAAALARTDENLGAILDAVAAREAASCAAGACEEWTVIVVTDHGHQPQQGFGHGFQSPRETSTFVIVDGPGFGAGEMNNAYTIADITPTVVKLFGIEPTRDADGVPLMDRGATQVDPVDLQAALQAQIDSYGWPDPVTTLALSVRTVFASIPYFVDDFTNQITDLLQGIVEQDIVLVSALAAIAVIPVQFVGAVLYAVTDFIAQIVARLTGAGVIPPSKAPNNSGDASVLFVPEYSIAV